MNVLKSSIIAFALTLAAITSAAQDAVPGTFTIADAKFDNDGRAVVDVCFQSEIEGYNGLMMKFWMPEDYKTEFDSYGLVCDINPDFVRNYTIDGDERTSETDPDLVEPGTHFYRLVGFSLRPIPAPCSGRFFTFNVLAPQQNNAIAESVKVRVKNIQFSPSQGDTPAYINTFPDMEFNIKSDNLSGLELQPVAPAEPAKVYDLLGRPLGTDLDALSPGIYIVDGHKVRL